MTQLFKRRLVRVQAVIAALSLALVAALSVAGANPVAADPPTPLDDGGWDLVAHMSDSGGMFDGNGDLQPSYSYGTFVAAPEATTPDFQRTFAADSDKILFITGDLSIWAVADYGDLRTLIDARPGQFQPNLAFETGVNGTTANTMGNVLSRGAVEDPWISMDGDHSSAITNQRIVWGENDYPGTHRLLKNNHGGINVYVLPANTAPTVSVDADPNAVNEGATAAATGTVSDADGDTVSLTVDVGAVTNNGDGTWSWSFDTDDGPTQSQTVTVSADDGNGGTATATFALTVNNVAPVVESIVAPMAPMAIADQLVDVTATFSDPAGSSDEDYTCTVNFGDNSGDQSGTVDGTTCTGPGHAYSATGVYTVSVTVTDKDSGSGSATASDLVVIYDPAGGFVTGGGWIESPSGAYTADESLSGKASFGFVAKYKKGASVPDGNTQFQFKAGDLKFHSSSYEWLVVAGNKAQFRGEGTINGQPGYTFRISADDDNSDTFRIQIWGSTGAVYDNGSQQSLGGGSIKVHGG